MSKTRFAKTRFSGGSAFIMAVVLTSLLAILGIIFIMVARLDKMSTSAISENKSLNFAVDSVVAKISEQLVADTPGIIVGQEYYDYPDINNAWLASLEPFEAGGNYYWQQISDVTGFLSANAFSTQGVDVLPVGLSTTVYVHEYPVIPIDPNGVFLPANGISADADGDGIADSKWIELSDIASSKGKPIYAAIRVTDNGGMININTGHKFSFDPVSSRREDIDGSRQTQINLLALSGLPGDSTNSIDDANLVFARDPNGLGGYEENVIWQYGNPVGKYTPFDISDELELRSRFVVNHEDIRSRIEQLWTWSFNKTTELNTAIRTGGASNLTDWLRRAQYDVLDPSVYSYRHIATTYNMDRVINPLGVKMINVNRVGGVGEPNTRDLYEAVRFGLADANIFNDPLNCQLAVNIRDCGDSDANVSVIYDLGPDLSPATGDEVPHYGFERPCVFISELVQNLKYGAEPFPGAPRPEYRSYAIEIRKRHWGNNLDDWRLVIGTRAPISISNFARGGGRYHVIVFEDPSGDPNAWLSDKVVFSDSPDDGETGVDPNVILSWADFWRPEATKYDVYLGTDYNAVSDANNTTGLWPEYIGNQAGLSFYPGPLSPNNITYYWRIDDTNDANVVIPGGDGEVWKFTTGDPKPEIFSIAAGEIVFEANSVIELRRYLAPTFTEYIKVDSVVVPPVLMGEGINTYKRDVSRNVWIKRLWRELLYPDPNLAPKSLGNSNDHSHPAAAANKIPSHLRSFNNVGEIGKIFAVDPYLYFNSLPLQTDRIDTNESDMRFNLADPAFQQLFRYLTIMDPDQHGKGPAETRVKGRININTAPWYVIAQLPWVQYPALLADPNDNMRLAQAIVAYRDKLFWDPNADYSGGRQVGMASPILIPVREDLGFASIGELMNVTQDLDFPAASAPYYDIRRYGRDGSDEQWYPDLTTHRRRRYDGLTDDFEERDLIFARISDLVTVRSDVFTAYILVRIGVDGPQKRVIAILDRSGINSPDGKVKIIALHPVPDPR